MKKTILLFLLIATSIFSYAQTYNNEWIDYSKTYYKFEVGATGLYRISQPALASIGLGNIPAQEFQLWRNGVEVPLYTSVSNGQMGGSDFLEFYGLMNDGIADTELYKYDSLQMSSHYSLYTDTAAYFLTVNPTGITQRFANTMNNVAGNTLAPEPYCTYVYSNYYRQNLNQGFGENLGDIIYSSCYETAEGWSSDNISASTDLQDNDVNLQVYPNGPTATFDADIAGNASGIQAATAYINGISIASSSIVDFNIDRMHVTGIPLSDFINDSIATVQIFNTGTIAGLGIVVADYRITYPRKFNFGGQSQFSFQLPASNTGNYLTITNFNYANTAPVLYDITDNIRLTGVIDSGIVQFVLPPSGTSGNMRQFVLLSADPTVLNTINSFTQRNFVNYATAANQGNYIIISNSLLYNDGSGNNNVENYREYRSSAAGGGYNAITVDIDQLLDQFAFGVKHHPGSIRNFSAYALAKFAVQPKFLFLIGKGLNYEEFRSYESNPNINWSALVPTFGWPGSDNLLSATRTGEYATIPLGRLSAISGTEVGYYLAKVEQFEQVQKTDSQSISSKAWMKNIAQITGGLSDSGLSALITSYMLGYSATAVDTLFGANVYQFSQNSGLNTAVGTNLSLGNLFTNGLSLLTYFGHSSPNSIEFNLNSPANYNNTGKYPAIIINGCEAGDLYEFDSLRTTDGGTLSELWTFANKNGSIAFIANSSFGLPTELNYVNTGFYGNLCDSMYGQPLGNIMQNTMKNVYNTYFSDYVAQTHVEQINLHGDPAVMLNPQSLPDYAIVDSLVTFNPSTISVANGNVVMTARIINIGKAVNDSVPVLIQRKLPNNTIQVLFNGKIYPVNYEDSIVLTININPLTDTGLNTITVTIDPNNTIAELSKSNNTITTSFTILADGITPIWPYQYAIVSNPNVQLYGSTASPTSAPMQYVMQMDTTALFNSPLKITRTVTDSGGVIQFTPGIAFSDSTVYYWRVGVGPINNNTTWLTSSFVYINGSAEGFNQSHYFQYNNDNFTSMNIDSTTRQFGFSNETRDLLIRTGLYPYYNWDQINVNVNSNTIEYYGCDYNSIQILVYDSLTLNTWKNYSVNGSGLYGSVSPACDPSTPVRSFFEFPYNNINYRKAAMEFLDTIPNGEYVSISNLSYIYNTTFVNQWAADTAVFGSGQSLLNTFLQLGLTKIDSFTTNLPFLFVFKKGEPSAFPISQTMGPTVSSQIVNSYNITGKQVQGTIQTPWLGSATAWSQFKWDEKASDSSNTTQKRFDIIGKDTSGNQVTLTSVYNSKDTDISFINAALYPNLALLIYNQDSLHAQATQLKYWMLTATKVPEGAVSPNLLLSSQDTLNLTDTLHFRVAFKNVSNVAFDSLKVRLTITDVNGNPHYYTNLANGNKMAPLGAGDTVIVYYDIPVLSYPGQNQLMLEVNPDNDQPEQFHFNNILYQSFYVLSPVCPGGNTSFTTGTDISGSTYQWQVNNGAGYTNITADSIYSGVNSSTLLLNTPPTFFYGYKYRCTITSSTSITYSPEFTLNFSDSWTGNIDTAWENAGNWNCGVLPDINTDVVIKSGLSNYPVISSAALCRSLSAAPKTSVTVKAKYSLEISGPPSTSSTGN